MAKSKWPKSLRLRGGMSNYEIKSVLAGRRRYILGRKK